jgi:hypothetical protein
MTARAIFRAAKVEQCEPPYDTLHLQIFYPASTATLQPGSLEIPADRQRAPFPVILFFNGINCEPELYRWLALSLVERGFVVVTFSWVAENIPGIVGLTPGVALQNLVPGVYGTQPTASALPTLLAELERVQAEGVLAGLLDLDRVVIGGHSAGGRVAVESANPQFFPQIKAAFGYGVHTAAVTQLGYDSGTILPLPDALPLLLIGGTCDGIIANSAFRYGVTWEQPTTPILRTFQEAIAAGRQDSYILLLAGANHFTIAHPFEPIASLPFLDFPATQPQDTLRSIIADAIAFFIQAHVCDRAHPPLTRNSFSPADAIAYFECK